MHVALASGFPRDGIESVRERIIPEVGETVEVDGLRLKVEHMEGRRITRVRLTRA